MPILHLPQLIGLALGFELEELDAAACTGAGIISDGDPYLQDTLNARTLAMAEKMDLPLMDICSPCVGVHRLAAEKLELPADRIGDVVVLAARDGVIGKSPEDHDLSLLGGRLRSHGGRYEEMVPFLISEPLNAKYTALAKGDPRNFDIFDFICNGTQS